jgi:hypothetical protein
MFRARKFVAVLALLALAGLAVTAPSRGPVGAYREENLAMWAGLAPLAVAIVAVLLSRPWGRWLALATAVAVLPWAGALTFGETYGAPTTRPAIARGSAARVLLSLTGRTAYRGFEGSARNIDWSGRRMTLVRWTLILNLASGFGLFLFAVFYQPRVAWHALIPGTLFIGTLAGVLLLARQRTAGLLMVALCCLLLVPAGGYFVAREASYTGEAVLFWTIFAPGVLVGFATLTAFARPMARALRSG